MLKIKTILSIAGATAGTKKTFFVLSAPMTSEARLINRRKGNIILVRSTVSENFSGEFIKPGAMIVTMAGEKMIPKKHASPTTIRIKVNVILTSRRASSSPCFDRYSVNTGIKADDIDPSAKSSRRRFGILNAAKNVSEIPVAPKYTAKIMSLTKPRIRLINVAADIIPAALAIFPFPSISALIISNAIIFQLIYIEKLSY
jgi:hypothetical protein